MGLHRGEEEAEGDDIANDADDVAGHVGGNHDAQQDGSIDRREHNSIARGNKRLEEGWL